MIHPPLVRIDGWVIIFSSISDNGDGGGNGSGGREFIHHHDQYDHWSLCRYNDLPFQSYYVSISTGFGGGKNNTSSPFCSNNDDHKFKIRTLPPKLTRISFTVYPPLIIIQDTCYSLGVTTKRTGKIFYHHRHHNYYCFCKKIDSSGNPTTTNVSASLSFHPFIHRIKDWWIE